MARNGPGRDTDMDGQTPRETPRGGELRKIVAATNTGVPGGCTLKGTPVRYPILRFDPSAPKPNQVQSPEVCAGFVVQPGGGKGGAGRWLVARLG